MYSLDPMGERNVMSNPRIAFGCAAYSVPIVVASFELTPAWSLYHLPWPIWYWYAIVVIGGVVGGAILTERSFHVGALAGAIAAPCATFALESVLVRTGNVNTALLLIIGGLGSLPGMVLFRMLAARDR